jgi:hypothetical protein
MQVVAEIDGQVRNAFLLVREAISPYAAISEALSGNRYAIRMKSDDVNTVQGLIAGSVGEPYPDYVTKLNNGTALPSNWDVSDQWILRKSSKLGLIRAIECFDPSKGDRLATLARWHIRRYMFRATDRARAAVRVSEQSTGELADVARWPCCVVGWREGACSDCMACTEPPQGGMLQSWESKTAQAPRTVKSPKLGRPCCVRRTLSTCRKRLSHGSMLTAERTHPPSFRGSKRERATPGRKTAEDRRPLPTFDADCTARTRDRRGQGGCASVACS